MSKEKSEYENKETQEFFKDLYLDNEEGIQLRKGMFNNLNYMKRKIDSLSKEEIDPDSTPYFDYFYDHEPMLSDSAGFIKLPMTVRRLKSNPSFYELCYVTDRGPEKLHFQKLKKSGKIVVKMEKKEK